MKNTIAYEIDKKQLEQVTGGAGAHKRYMTPARIEHAIAETNRRMRREYIERLQEQNMQQESVAEVQAQ